MRPRAKGPYQSGARTHVVFLVSALIIGGAQRQLVELASELDRSQWQVTVVVFRSGGELESELVSRGTTVISIGKRGRADLVGFFIRLVKDLRRLHPDVVHGYLSPGNVMAVATRPFATRKATLWGIRASSMELSRYDRWARALARLEQKLARFTDVIVCNSEAGRASHVALGYPPDRMRVVSNGIDSGRFAADPAARLAVRAQWDIKESETLVGIVSRLDPKKDHETFIRAAALLADVPDLRFVSIGNDPRGRRGELIREAERLGVSERLTWHDAREDVARAYSGLDLLVSSSAWGEGFPNVVGEAMATQVPCVVTDVGDSALVVGDTGWVCAPSDPEALAVAIRHALTSRAQLSDRGAQARERIVREFSIRRMVENTSLVMEESLGVRQTVQGR